VEGSVGPLRLHQKIPEHVADYLREAIFAGALRPNQQLALVAIASELDVSTTPVREALLILEREGLVVRQSRRGFRVVDLSKSDVLDIYWLHGKIAGILSERATPLLSDSEIARLETLNRRMEVAARDGDDGVWGQLNWEFHRRIYRAAPQSILHRFLAMTARTVSRRVFPGVTGWTAVEHVPIVEALKQRDASRVRQLIEDHQRSGADLMIAELELKGIWAERANESGEDVG
jgi:DNA-binding GntR family transcriptional regulator